MIVARVATALRKQEWATFAIEFVLVIAGVLVALEVDNWNQERLVEQEFRRQLQLLRVELADNRARLATTLSYFEDDMEQLAALQRAFHDEVDGPAFRQAEADMLVMRLVGLPTQLVRSGGVDRLLASQSILGASYAPLRQLLDEWSQIFTRYQRTQTDSERYRNDVILPLLTESHSQRRVAALLLADTPYRIAVPADGDEFRKLLADERVENAAVSKLLITREVGHLAGRLDDATAAASAELDRLLGASPPDGAP